jgi:hypothetical protein
MARKGTFEGVQKTVILNEELQTKLDLVKNEIGLSTDSDTLRFLINDYCRKNNLNKTKQKKE